MESVEFPLAWVSHLLGFNRVDIRGRISQSGTHAPAMALTARFIRGVAVGGFLGTTVTVVYVFSERLCSSQLTRPKI